MFFPYSFWDHSNAQHSLNIVAPNICIRLCQLLCWQVVPFLFFVTLTAIPPSAWRVELGLSSLMDAIDGCPVWNEGSYTEKPCRGLRDDHKEFLHEHPNVPKQTEPHACIFHVRTHSRQVFKARVQKGNSSYVNLQPCTYEAPFCKHCSPLLKYIILPKQVVRSLLRKHCMK